MKSNTPKMAAKQLVICVENDGYVASLERRKVYVALREVDAAKLGLLRIIDESGDDYLCPKTSFVSVKLEPAKEKAVLAA